MALQIYLFGSPRVERDGERQSLRRRKSVALMSYLMVTGQPHDRETLAAMLWPENEAAKAKANLRRDLHWLRQLLRGDVFLSNWLQVELNPEVETWVDVLAFAHLLERAERTEEPEKRVALLQEAAALYQGDFLAGFNLRDSPQFDEWQFFQRDRYRQQVAEVWQQLVAACVQQGAYEQGLAYGRSWVALDALHEPAQRELMKLYAWSNQHTAALRQYEECVRLLDDELGVAPEPETQALFEAIRNREFGLEGAGKGGEGRERREMDKVQVMLTPQLPIPSTPFIGREQELARVTTLLTQSETRLVTLAGSGGMGKTRLALAAGTAVADYFPHGVTFVPLAPLSSAEHIPTALAHSLQLSLNGNNPEAQLFAYLQDKRMLLIMDNFEHLLSDSRNPVADRKAIGEQLIADILQAAPHMKILATTRERLNLVGEMVLALGGLPVAAENMAEMSSAAQLFRQHVQLVRPQLVIQPEEQEAINHICRLVEGMPLALILAASWAEMLSLAEIGEEIARDLDFLETDMVDMPQRQRSVRAVFDASWRRLTVVEQKVFQQLSVFRDGFTRAAAQAVTGANLRTLRGLVQKLFVTLEANGRYQIHELLRQYGAERLTAVAGETSARAAHTKYYFDFLQQREADLQGRRQLAAAQEIDADLENVRIAWNWALAQQDEAAIMYALEGLHLFIENSGRYIEGIAMLEQAQRRLVPDGKQTDNATWGRLASRCNFMRLVSSGYHEVLDGVSEQCVQTARQVNDRFEIAFSLYFHTYYLFAVKHEIKDSIAYLEEALTIFRDLGNDFFAARTLTWLGIITLQSSSLQKGRAYMEEGLALAQATGNMTDTSNLLSNLCEIVLALGDYEAGEAYAREALSVATQLEQRVGFAYAAVVYGVYFVLRGDLDRAEAQIKAGWEKAKVINFAVTLTYASALLSLCHSFRGNYQDAQQWAEEGLVNPMNDGFGHILGHWAMAVAQLGLGEAGQTWVYVRQMIEHVQAYPSLAMLTWLLPITAVLHAQNEEWETAVHHLALAYTHPLSPTGYLDKWSLLGETQARLQTELGQAAYQAAWQKGQSLALEAIFETE